MRQFLFSRKKKNKKAQGAVEFALILPVLMLLLLGLIETGRLIFYYSAVTNAAREAARYGSATGLNDDGNFHFEDCDEIIAAAVDVGFLGSVQPDDVSVVFDSGPGTAVLGGCPGNFAGAASQPTNASIQTGARIVVEVASPFDTVIPGLLPYQGLTVRAESSRTIIRSVNIAVDDVVDPPDPPDPPAATATNTATPSVTLTPTETPLFSPTPTMTLEPSITFTSTSTASPTFTPTITNTPQPIYISWVNPATSPMQITSYEVTRFEVVAYDPNVCSGTAETCNGQGIQQVYYEIYDPAGIQIRETWSTAPDYCVYGPDEIVPQLCSRMAESHWNGKIRDSSYIMNTRAKTLSGVYTEWITTTFYIPQKLPPFVVILAPSAGQIISSIDQTAFQAYAYDPDVCVVGPGIDCNGAGISQVKIEVINPSNQVVASNPSDTSAPYCLEDGTNVCLPYDGTFSSIFKKNTTYIVRVSVLPNDSLSPPVWTVVTTQFTVPK